MDQDISRIVHLTHNPRFRRFNDQRLGAYDFKGAAHATQQRKDREHKMPARYDSGISRVHGFPSQISRIGWPSISALLASMPIISRIVGMTSTIRWGVSIIVPFLIPGPDTKSELLV